MKDTITLLLLPFAVVLTASGINSDNFTIVIIGGILLSLYTGLIIYKK